jgi:hypothetical protein
MRGKSTDKRTTFIFHSRYYGGLGRSNFPDKVKPKEFLSQGLVTQYVVHPCPVHLPKQANYL